MKEGRRLYHLIVNPAAGNGRTLKVCTRVESELEKRGLPFRVTRTERPGHATIIAREIASGEAEARLVVLGGGRHVQTKSPTGWRA